MKVCMCVCCLSIAQQTDNLPEGNMCANCIIHVFFKPKEPVI